MAKKTQAVSDRADRFPRSRDLPTQSPLFWVQQKERYLRQLLVRDIEEDTGRRLVVYFANRYEAGSDIQGSDVANVAEALGDVGASPVDILLETSGGLTDATESIISLVQSTVSDLRVIV